MKRTGHVARVRQATARLALVQSKYVPWPHLAKVADEYTEWHVFALWARAIVDAAADVPIAVRTEIERRAPGVYGFLRPRLKSLINHGERPGILVWEDMTCWLEMNVYWGGPPPRPCGGPLPSLALSTSSTSMICCTFLKPR